MQCLQRNTDFDLRVSQAYVVEGILSNGLLSQLMTLKSEEASIVLVEFCAWVATKLETLNTSSQALSSDQLKDIEELKVAQKGLVRM